ncbi:MAG: hypothetical protein EOO41_03955 [Methanobacteriota archaeon]|nr:MAG: hypothetical protein EOO41_03955 [Euryarchaeota archaeon]
MQMVVDKHTGKRRGFAFVSFTTAEHAHQAVQRLHGATFRGRALRVARATKPGSGPIENPGWGTMDLPPPRTPAAPPLPPLEGHEEQASRHGGPQPAAGGGRKRLHAAAGGAGSARVTSRKNLPPINMGAVADAYGSMAAAGTSPASGCYGSSAHGVSMHDALDASTSSCFPHSSPRSFISRHSGQRTPATVRGCRACSPRARACGHVCGQKLFLPDWRTFVFTSHTSSQRTCESYTCPAPAGCALWRQHSAVWAYTPARQSSLQCRVARAVRRELGHEHPAGHEHAAVRILTPPVPQHGRHATLWTGRHGCPAASHVARACGSDVHDHPA